MPWTFVGTRICNPGANTTLFTNVIVNENFAVHLVTQPSTTRIYWGVLEYVRQDIIPSNTTVVVNPTWTLWGPAFNVKIGNASAGGFVRFRLRKRITQAIELNVYRFLP